MKTPRAIILVLDSVGCGGAPDAAAYGDAGADTVGHIAEACAVGRGNREGLRAGPVRLPHLDALGLGHACRLATGRVPPGLSANGAPRGIGTAARSRSGGKDTPSGHWEIAGAPFPGRLHVFPDTHPSLPPDLSAALVREGGLPGILADRHADGVGVIEQLGQEHLRTGAPIVYTSTDSVLQIAAHEEAFGLERLYQICNVARRLVDPLGVGRVIARPFVGTKPGAFRRTPHRRDFPIPPPPGNLLDRAAEAGRGVISLGKIGDIFGHRATGEEIKGANNDAIADLALAALERLPEGGLLFANLVDFDTEFGHRRDVAGYAAALEAFDGRLPAIIGALRPDDLLLITADHGNDPTAPGSNHTRECVPVLCVGPYTPRVLPLRGTFADIGQSVAAHLGLAPVASGTSFLSAAR